MLELNTVMLIHKEKIVLTKKLILDLSNLNP